MTDKTTIERERIKKIVIRKCDYFIKTRKRNYNYKRLKSNILFSIDNPDYIRIKDRKAKI